MEEEAKKPEAPEKTTDSVADLPESKKSMINTKVILFGLPLFILQLIVVYFVTANILLNKVQGNSPVHQTAVKTEVPKENKEKKEDEEKKKAAIGKFIYSVDDVIVNPAGTSGDQLLLTSIAFDVATQEGEKELKEKEIIVKDMIISVLSSKTIGQLNNTLYKDTLRTEISKKLQTNLPEVKVNKVYFSKYIIN